MSTFEYSYKRITSFLDEINLLRKSEFPYKDSELALDILKKHFLAQKKLLESLSNYDSKIIDEACTNALNDLMVYLPLLGFILRSTNVRNAFESYGPLLQLSKVILKSKGDNTNEKAHLIISSEWHYSPFTYKGIPAFPNFILIGLPAHESGNPLLIPLAGHELGHHIWHQEKMASNIEHLENRIRETIYEEIMKQWSKYTRIFSYLGLKKPDDFYSSLYTPQTWALAKRWSLKQAEESFCDFIGLRIFGKSYLHAFAYLLSPNHSMNRALGYPTMKNRVKNLMKAAKEYDIICDQEYYESMFNESFPPALAGGELFQLSLSDNTTQRIVKELINIARDSIVIPSVDDNGEELKRIQKRFKKLIPAENCTCLADILNAAWDFYDSNKKQGVKLWDNLSYISDDKQNKIFEELVLKNIQVFEIEQILKNHNHIDPK